MNVAYQLPIPPEAVNPRMDLDQRLYYVEPAMELRDWNEEMDEYGVVGFSPFVIVSASTAYATPETYIFPAAPDGRITDFGELPGSFQGELNHARALDNAGYAIHTEIPERVRETIRTLSGLALPAANHLELDQ